MKHNDWVRDPETGEYGQLKSLRVLIWNYVKPAYMWARLGIVFGLWGFMFYLFFNGGL
jgi:hypothetical protein